MTFDTNRGAGDRQGRAYGRRTSAGLAAATALLAFALAQPSFAEREVGAFPTAEEVGGDVFPQVLNVGDTFPMDIDLYDNRANKVSLADLTNGKRTVLAMFITAVPSSVAELKKLEKVVNTNKTQLLFLNTDFVGTALDGRDPIQETARTLRVIQHEEKLKTPMYVAPNDVFSPDGLANRIGLRSLPTVIVLDENQTIENIFVGARDWKRGDI